MKRVSSFLLFRQMWQFYTVLVNSTLRYRLPKSLARWSPVSGRFRGIDRAYETPSRKNLPPRARMKYRLIDEASIFQKAPAIAAVQISAPNISLSRCTRARWYGKGGLRWEHGVGWRPTMGIRIKTRRFIDCREACFWDKEDGRPRAPQCHTKDSHPATMFRPRLCDRSFLRSFLRFSQRLSSRVIPFRLDFLVEQRNSSVVARL